MEAASFDEQLAAALLGEDSPYPLSAESCITYPQSQWDFGYDLVDQFITPPSYASNSSGSLNGDNDDNNDNVSVKMLVSSGGEQEPGLSKKRKVETKELAVSGGTRTRKRHPSQVQDHILAERKRREILSHMFISLSTMIPCPKKMDKISILGDAIKHMKQLQEKVKVLEKVAAQHDAVKSMVVVKNQLTVDEDSDDNDDNGSSSTVDDISASGCGGSGSNDGSSNNVTNLNKSIAEIEVKISDKTLLLEVYCEKQKGIMAKLFAVLDKHNMSITNCSIIPFENLALDITIVAQKEESFDKDVKGFVRALRSVLRQASPRCQSSNVGHDP